MYTLRKYQEDAVHSLLENKLRYLAYDMGLGKTLIMLDFLRRTRKKALVVAPLLVAQRTWPLEIQKWTPEITYSVLHGKDKDEELKAGADIKIINFEGLKWLATKNIALLRGHILIIDEASSIKSNSSMKFKVLRNLRHIFEKEGIYLLSGTPMPNGYKDLWSQYFILDGGKSLGTSYSKYMNTMFIQSGPPRWQTVLKEQNVPALQKQIAKVTSVLRAEDHAEMPESTFITVPIELPPEAMKAYNQYKKDKVLEIADGAITADTAAIHSGKMRQIAQGAVYTDEGYMPMHTAKLEALQQLVNEANGEPILCPIYFSFERAMICDWLKEQVPCIAGGMSAKAKQDILDEWDKGNIPLLLCQPGSLSHGVNMQTGGSIIVWYGRPWSLELFSQLNGRLIRPGQTKMVRIYYIHAVGTADEKVAEVLESKAATQEAFKAAILSDFE